MTGAALVAVLWPLRQRSVTAAAESGNDAAVYRDQLHEIERDLAAGSLGANEAEALGSRYRVGCSRQRKRKVPEFPIRQPIATWEQSIRVLPATFLLV
jgi:cytochrome c-type biogenesis protein CcmH/NrfG